METVDVALTEHSDTHNWHRTHQLRMGDGQYRGTILSGMLLLQILLVHAAHTPLPAILPFSLDEDVDALLLLCLSSGFSFFRYLHSTIDKTGQCI